MARQDDRGGSQEKRKSVLRNKLGGLDKKQQSGGIVGSIKSFFGWMIDNDWWLNLNSKINLLNI